MTTHFAILDTNAGLLQWTGKAADEAAAFGEMLGYNEEEPGVFERGAFDVREVTAKQRAALEAWSDRGSPAVEFPL